jgi:hypothetical protein
MISALEAMGSCHRFQTHALDTLPCKIYPMTQEEDKSLLKFLQEQEAKGYICPSISPYISPFSFTEEGQQTETSTRLQAY